MKAKISIYDYPAFNGLETKYLWSYEIETDHWIKPKESYVSRYTALRGAIRACKRLGIEKIKAVITENYALEKGIGE